jgi:hypothetical protein
LQIIIAYSRLFFYFLLAIKGILLSIIFAFSTEIMRNLNNITEKSIDTSAATTFLLLGTILIVAGVSTPLTATTTPLLLQSAVAQDFMTTGADFVVEPKAPSVVSGDNIYIAWWTNNTENGNEEVMFRASNDGGATFSNKTNLSNSSDADSSRVEIAGEGENVVVSWWETNQTSDIPAARVSNDGGQTFGPMIMLAANGTLGSGEAEEIAIVDEEGGEG